MRLWKDITRIFVESQLDLLIIFLYITAMSKNALKKAVEIVGSQSELARRIGVKQQNIWSWLNRPVPAEFVIPIERATDGQVTRHELRPDIYPEQVV